MTTLADITLRVAREITDVLNGSATVGNGTNPVTSINDQTNLIQKADQWARGTLWFRSGTGLIGIMVPVTTFASATLNFASIGVINPSVQANYSVTGQEFPTSELIKAVNAALADGAKVLTADTSITATGASSYTLPAGVSNVRDVEFQDSSGQRTPSTHWKERAGSIYFDYPPPTGDTVVLWYRAAHSELIAYGDAVNSEISDEWLLWKSVEKALTWALNMYGDSPEKGYASKLQQAIQELQSKNPHRTRDVIIHTA